jgi:hypothetical protein
MKTEYEVTDMLETFIQNNNSVYLNSLRRYVFSGVVVPSQANMIVKVPAMVGTNAGMSLPIPLEGPQDAFTEIKSVVGFQGLRRVGTGTFTALAGGVAMTGIGTNFSQELLIGDTIIVVDDLGAVQTKTIATVTGQTTATVTVAFANNVNIVPPPPPAVFPSPFVYFTPVIADVQNRMTVDIQDMAWNRKLMNKPVPVVHVFGTNQFPGYFAEDILLEKNQIAMFKFYNNSTSGNGSVSFSHEGRKWQLEAHRRPEVAKLIKEKRDRKTFLQPYWLTLDNDIRVDGNSQATGFLTCTGDIDLFLFDIRAHIVNSGAAPVGDIQEFVEFQLSYTRNGRFYQSAPFTLNTGTGTAGQPFPLPHPILLKPQSQIKVSVRSLLTSATQTDVFLTMHGVGLYTGRSGITDPSILKEARRIWVDSESPVSERCKF